MKRYELCCWYDEGNDNKAETLPKRHYPSVKSARKAYDKLVAKEGLPYDAYIRVWVGTAKNLDEWDWECDDKETVGDINLPCETNPTGKNDFIIG